MTHRLSSAIAAGLILIVIAGGCDQRSASAAIAKTDSVAVGPSRIAGTPAPTGAVVDSALPLDEELRRFRTNLARVTVLENGAPSRDALVSQFIGALERADTAALVRLHVTRAEYAWLVYPSSPNAHPPFHQPPEIAWMLSKAASEKGLTRLMRRRSGNQLGVVGYTCDPKPTREGENTIWRGCELRTASSTSIENTRQRLFGSIIERGGRFKFLSYKNQF